MFNKLLPALGQLQEMVAESKHRAIDNTCDHSLLASNQCDSMLMKLDNLKKYHHKERLQVIFEHVSLIVDHIKKAGTGAEIYPSLLGGRYSVSLGAGDRIEMKVIR